nr:tripartite tricarboxylate transporter substrate-binding protein [Verminephrobacter aporrectodeae]
MVASRVRWVTCFGPRARWQSPALLTSQSVIARLNAETRTALSDAALRERIVSLGLEPISSTPQELATFGRSELEKWMRLIRAIGIEPE